METTTRACASSKEAAPSAPSSERITRYAKVANHDLANPSTQISMSISNLACSWTGFTRASSPAAKKGVHHGKSCPVCPPLFPKLQLDASGEYVLADDPTPTAALMSSMPVMSTS